MKNGRKQAKDISDQDFLLGILYTIEQRKQAHKTVCATYVQRFLADDLATIQPLGKYLPASDHVEKEIPYKLVTAKAKSLIRRGLIDGCGCGCRGDFEILPKGYEKLMGE